MNRQTNRQEESRWQRIWRRWTGAGGGEALANRAGTAPVRPAIRLAANPWRERFNPLRGLTLARAVALLEGYARGEMAELQWTYFHVESADPDLFALVERRTAALLDMEWRIRLREGAGEAAPGAKAGESLALEQAAALREAYERVDNLYEAIEHLGSASFRGFAHVEKQRDAAGRVRRLEILDQWNTVRDGLRGGWKYNPEARPATYAGLPGSCRLEPGEWLIREVRRHINRIGLLKFVRSSMAQKDWDGYLETYGLPGAVVIGPPNLQPGDELLYTSLAEQVSLGTSAYLPNGAALEFYDGPRQNSPFPDYLRNLTEQLVLAGTGGILNMLAQSGSGTLAGSVHAAAFAQIARGEARQVSELFQRQLDPEILEAEFPGRPRLAWFELSSDEPVDVNAMVDHAVKLRQAGYRVDARQLTERTGYRLNEEASAPGTAARPA